MSAQRRGQVGAGNRTDKIRTYNFKENRVTDHRINLTLYKLDQVLAGDLDELTDALDGRQAGAPARRRGGRRAVTARGAAAVRAGATSADRGAARGRADAECSAGRRHEARFIVDEVLAADSGGARPGVAGPGRSGRRGPGHGGAPCGGGAAAVRLRPLALPPARPAASIRGS